MGTGGPFLGDKSRPGRDSDQSPPSSAEVEIDWELYLLLPQSSDELGKITYGNGILDYVLNQLNNAVTHEISDYFSETISIVAARNNQQTESK
jgi:hypothetical protein